MKNRKHLGVRTYNSGTHRFEQIDRLWEKYISWTPYHYCGNDTVNKVDVDGKDLIILLDRDGAGSSGVNAGHAAVLIGNDKDGWSLYSKNGGEYGVAGESKDPQYGQDKPAANARYKTLEEFRKKRGKDARQARYDEAYFLKNDDDKQAKINADAAVRRDYNVATDNCTDAVSEALKGAGYDPGNTFNIRKDSDGEAYTTSSGCDPRPNVRFHFMVNNNGAKNYYNQVLAW